LLAVYLHAVLRIPPLLRASLLTALMLGASACGGDHMARGSASYSPKTTPHPVQPADAFLASLVRSEFLNQFPLIYTWIDPSQRRKIPRRAFVAWELDHASMPPDVTFISATRVWSRNIRRDGLSIVEMKLRVLYAHGADAHSTLTVTYDAANRGDHWTWLLPAPNVSGISTPAAA
jgi:hypothetical protein